MFLEKAGANGYLVTPPLVPPKKFVYIQFQVWWHRKRNRNTPLVFSQALWFRTVFIYFGNVVILYFQQNRITLIAARFHIDWRAQ